jgi:hypothetical protein
MGIARSGNDRSGVRQPRLIRMGKDASGALHRTSFGNSRLPGLRDKRAIETHLTPFLSRSTCHTIDDLLEGAVAYFLLSQDTG